MTFPCPTIEEIQAASDAITKDGVAAEATALLSVVTVMSPVFRESTDEKVKLLKAFTASPPDYKSIPGGDLARELIDEAKNKGLDGHEVMLRGTVSSLTVYGLNIGIRIGEARREGMRSRQSVEHLLAHMRKDCAGTVSAEPEVVRHARTEAAIRVLQWVLGEQEGL